VLLAVGQTGDSWSARFDILIFWPANPVESAQGPSEAGDGNTPCRRLGHPQWDRVVPCGDVAQLCGRAYRKPCLGYWDWNFRHVLDALPAHSSCGGRPKTSFIRERSVEPKFDLIVCFAEAGQIQRAAQWG
jgi:hypothetical protein